MRYFIPFFFVLAVFVSCSDSETASGSDSVAGDSTVLTEPFEADGIGGVYSFGANPETEAVGKVTVYPESDSTILFFLDFTRGAPSYNTGQVAARAYKRNGAWTYSKSEPDAIDGCEIEFMFNEKFVQLVTRQTNCGFGANVIVDHVYNRSSKMVPQFFVGPEGDTVLFSNLAKSVR